MKKFSEFNLDYLENLTVLVDIDGTIVQDSAIEIDQDTRRSLDKLSARNTVHLITNSRDSRRNLALSEALNLPIVVSQYRKPDPRALGTLELKDATNVVVIGDKYLTDGRFARNIDARFIKVSTIKSENDSLFVRLTYWLDELIGRYYMPSEISGKK